MERKKYSIKVLVSTMDETDPVALFTRMNLSSEAIIVNQCGYDKEETLYVNNYKVTHLCCSERGLSRSRNKAISYSSDCDIALLADDDLIYTDNYYQVVQETFDKYIDYDIITFRIEGINKYFKQYREKAKRLNYFTTLKTSSVEIAFRPNEIYNSNIKFNELFGSGSVYKMGEENIFLFECLRNGLKIRYEPKKIADLYIGESSWFTGFNEKYFFDRGAIFCALSHRMAFILIIQFGLRHFRRYKSEITLFGAFRAMLDGCIDYRNKLGEK